jgi:hypothetical protein
MQAFFVNGCALLRNGGNAPPLTSFAEPKLKKIRAKRGLVPPRGKRPPVGLLGGWGRANSAPFTGKHENAIKNPECNRPWLR